ncbi:MAG TPA: hypothetical protein VLW50_11210 [Streptosporangiaceae bacterium]|nr:hypothetical protein [Streptosporangiaceae bacterium]
MSAAIAGSSGPTLLSAVDVARPKVTSGSDPGCRLPSFDSGVLEAGIEGVLLGSNVEVGPLLAFFDDLDAGAGGEGEREAGLEGGGGG